MPFATFVTNPQSLLPCAGTAIHPVLLKGQLHFLRAPYKTSTKLIETVMPILTLNSTMYTDQGCIHKVLLCKDFVRMTFTQVHSCRLVIWNLEQEMMVQSDRQMHHIQELKRQPTQAAMTLLLSSYKNYTLGQNQASYCWQSTWYSYCLTCVYCPQPPGPKLQVFESQSYTVF